MGIQLHFPVEHFLEMQLHVPFPWSSYRFLSVFDTIRRAASADDEREDAVRRVAGDVAGDLRPVQGAGAAVDERDTGQRQVGAHAVGDGEVECALDRAAFLFEALPQG